MFVSLIKLFVVNVVLVINPTITESLKSLFTFGFYFSVNLHCSCFPSLLIFIGFMNTFNLQGLFDLTDSSTSYNNICQFSVMLRVLL